MTRRIYAFDRPERFLSGTVGPPGQRTFFLQAKQDGRIVSVALEKTQVAVLADRIAAILDEISLRRGDAPASERIDPTATPELLDEPLQEAFRVGTMALAWDVEAEALIIEARAEAEEGEDQELEIDDDDPDGPDLVRVRLAPDEGRAFVRGAAVLLAAGRPPCPICGMPLNPEGHICARRNGYVN